MADILGGYLVAKALKRQGVECIFMLCGGHITPIYMGCAEEGIRLIDVRHEQSAGYAADAWARVTKKPGVAMVTAGPGVTNAVTAIANAHRAEVPMVVIGGRSPVREFEKGSLQEMDHTEILGPITKWARCIPSVDRIPDYVEIAFRKAASGRPGPVFLEIPRRGDIAKALGHLTASDVQEFAVHPVTGEVLLAGVGTALGDFVFVMRKDQVHTPSVDIQHRDTVSFPDLVERHGGALKVPAGPPAAEGSVPRGSYLLILFLDGLP